MKKRYFKHVKQITDECLKEEGLKILEQFYNLERKYLVENTRSKWFDNGLGCWRMFARYDFGKQYVFIDMVFIRDANNDMQFIFSRQNGLVNVSRETISKEWTK